jgi:hypothetical protein
MHTQDLLAKLHPSIPFLSLFDFPLLGLVGCFQDGLLMLVKKLELLMPWVDSSGP